MKLTESTTHNSKISRKMNWTAAGTNMQHPSSINISCCVKKTRLPFIVCLMLLCWIYSVPMVSCRTVLDIDNNDNIQHQKKSHIEEYNRNILNEQHHNEFDSIQHSHRRRSPHNSIYPLDEWSLSDTTHEKDNGNGQISKKIKDKVRRKLKKKHRYNRNKLHKENHETFQKLERMRSNENQGSSLKFVDYEKKYFDYFPIEKIELNNNETKVNDNIKVVLLPIDDNGNDDDNDDNNKENNKENHKKWKKITEIESNKKSSHYRSKRDATSNPLQIDNLIHKRNIATSEYADNVLNIEHGTIVNKNNLIRKNRNDYDRAEENGRYYSYGTSHNPWNNRYVKSFNNFQIPRFQNAGPFLKYNIPGIYYNPISPPGNYQPPRRPTTEGETPSLGSRFDVGDDRVIWDIQYTRRPLASSRPVSATQGPSIESATRRTPPPLIRDPTRQRPTVDSSTVTTRRTPPPLIRNPSRNSNSGNTVGRTPPATTTTTTTTTTIRPPAAFTPAASGRTEPSKCVWAIVSCCSRDDLTVRYSCFEQIGCHGAFWDLNPCADNIQEAALSEVEQFFD